MMTTVSTTQVRIVCAVAWTKKTNGTLNVKAHREQTRDISHEHQERIKNGRLAPVEGNARVQTACRPVLLMITILYSYIHLNYSIPA